MERKKGKKKIINLSLYIKNKIREKKTIKKIGFESRLNGDVISNKLHGYHCDERESNCLKGQKQERE